MIQELQIPFSFDVISSTRKNNTVAIQFDDSITTITLPSGTPDPGDLAVAFQEELRTYISSGFSVSFNNYTRRFTISHDTASFSIVWGSTSAYFHKLIGFSRDVEWTGQMSYTGDRIPNIACQRISLHSQIISQFSNNISNTGNDSDLILDIPVNTSPDSNLTIRKEVPFIYKSNTEKCLTHLDFYIKCDNDQIIDLNGQECCFELHYA